MLRKLSYSSAFLLALAGQAAAQATTSPLAPAPSADTVARLLAARATLERLGPSLGPSLWPGYRPDTIPTLLFLPGRGFLLAGWRGALPGGFERVQAGTGWRGVDAKGVASTGTELEGHAVAQAVVPAGMATAALVGLMAHEAFHVFERATHDAGASRQENAYYLSQYPVFDAVNDGEAVLEGRLLAAALRAPGRPAALEEARRFLAVRESRQRRLDPEIAAFEEGAELNEGRAEYALLRAQAAAGGGSVLAELGPRLDSLAQPERSVRLRFYATGAAQSLLLDRLAGAPWKDSLAACGGTLQDALARAVGYRAREEALRRAAAEEMGGARLQVEARSRVAGLQARRRTLADSLLARPGVLLVLSGDSVGALNVCGFDPQNLLPAGDETYLHTRWLRPCAAGLQGDLNAPTVELRARREMRAVIGPPDSVKVTVGAGAGGGGAAAPLEDGQPLTASDVRIDAPGANLTVRRARLERRGRELWVWPLKS